MSSALKGPWLGLEIKLQEETEKRTHFIELLQVHGALTRE